MDPPISGKGHLVLLTSRFPSPGLGGTAAMVGLTYVHSLWAGWLLFGLSGLFVACFWPTLLAVAGHHIAAASTSLFCL